MKVLEPAAEAAMRDYRTYRRSLEDEAKEAEKAQRPLLARRLRHYARLVAKARLAEEFNLPPTGIES